MRLPELRLTMEFTDWRYRQVYTLDELLHKVIGNRHWPGLCTLEQEMYWRRRKLRDLT